MLATVRHALQQFVSDDGAKAEAALWLSLYKSLGSSVTGEEGDLKHEGNDFLTVQHTITIGVPLSKEPLCMVQCRVLHQVHCQCLVRKTALAQPVEGTRRCTVNAQAYNIAAAQAIDRRHKPLGSCYDR